MWTCGRTNFFDKRWREQRQDLRQQDHQRDGRRRLQVRGSHSGLRITNCRADQCQQNLTNNHITIKGIDTLCKKRHQ